VKSFLFISLLASISLAQDYETTVHDLSFKSTNKTVIDEETIKNSKAPDVTTLLQSKANITFASTGFQKNTIYLRGGDSSHILILVDGVPVFDPGTAQRTFNLNLLNIKNIRRIEVFRGAQTVLYGGQALAGVIKIETFGKELKDQKLVQAEAGSDSYKQAGFIVQRTTGLNQAVQASVGGFSKEAASPLLDSNQKYPQSNLNADMAYNRRGESNFIVRLFRTDDKTHLPGMVAGYRTVDTTDLIQDTQFSGLTGSYKNNTSYLKPELLLGYGTSLRKFAQPMNDLNVFGGELEDIYISQGQNVRGMVSVFESEDILARAGISYSKETLVYRNLGVETTNSFGEQRGIFTKIDYNINPDYELELGARTDTIKDYASEGTQQVGLTIYEKTKLEYASGFRAPSQFQYYGSYGNKDLAPERSISYSATHDTALTENQNLSLSLFQIEFSNLIATKTVNFLPKYFNVSHAKTTGSELLYSFAPAPNIQGYLRYTYQEAKDTDTGIRLQRRPMNTGSFGLSKSWEGCSTGFEIIYSGDRETQLSSTRYKLLSEYTIGNIFYNQNLSDNLQAYIRINNVSDYRYEESYNYFNEGRFSLAGLSYVF
jgi:iron complex outermembrane receptor protein/vitamin B12 transporter